MGDIASFIKGLLGVIPAWAPYALQAGGTALRSRADNQVRQAQEQAVQQEIQRQRQIQAQQDANMAATIPQFTQPAQEAARGDQASRIETAITPAAEQPILKNYVPENESTPTVVTSDIARSVADALKKGRDYAKTTAAMQSFGVQNQDAGVALNRNAEKLRPLQISSRSSSNILPYQLQGAYNKGQGSRVASDVLNGAGGIASLYSALSR